MTNRAELPECTAAGAVRQKRSTSLARALRSLVLVAAVVLLTAPARRVGAGTPAAEPAPRSNPAEEGHRLSWSYPRFRSWQYAAALAATGANVYDGSFRTRSDRADRWKGGILFDDAVRSVLRSDSAALRHDADVASDWLWQPPELYPLVIDSLFVPLVLDDFNVDVSWQMSMLYWQSISLASLALRAIRYPAGRARPADLDRCAAAREGCRLQSLSFPSGHAQMVAAGAGVGCAHHLALPLYGGGWPDIAACAVLGAMTVANGALRVVSDRHWATDVLSGWALGGAIGFGLPWLLHYRTPASGGSAALWKEVLVLPFAADGALGLTMVGQL